MEVLVCKKCGYKQYDDDTMQYYMKKFPNTDIHDIPYVCGACEGEKIMERELAVQATLYLKMEEDDTEESALDRLYMYIDTDVDISVHQTEVREV